MFISCTTLRKLRFIRSFDLIFQRESIFVGNFFDFNTFVSVNAFVVGIQRRRSLAWSIVFGFCHFSISRLYSFRCLHQLLLLMRALVPVHCVLPLEGILIASNLPQRHGTHERVLAHVGVSLRQNVLYEVTVLWSDVAVMREVAHRRLLLLNVLKE